MLVDNSSNRLWLDILSMQDLMQLRMLRFARALMCCWLAAAAIIFVSAPARGTAGVAVETQDLLTFEYQEVGANEEEAVRLACIRAVHATLGRLMFSDFSLQARDLLGPYIQKNWQRFVASYYVLERRFERDGYGARIRVQTFPEVLHRDLRTKKFLYQPRLNPYHYVFFSQSIDGRAGDFELGRRAVVDLLIQDGQKVYESGVQVPENNADVMTDPALFAAAREAAQRIGAEIVVAARATTQRVSEEEIFFDVVTSVETQVEISFIRADDGTLLGSATATERGSAADARVAMEESILAAVESAIATILENTRGVWRSTILEQAKFSVMFTDLTPEEVRSVSKHLEATLGSQTKARLRSYHGGVAVISVDTERAYAALERAIQNYKAFDLRITDHQGKRITVDVKH